MRLTESSRSDTNIAFFFFSFFFCWAKLIKPLDGELIKVPAEEQRTKIRSSGPRASLFLFTASAARLRSGCARLQTGNYGAAWRRRIAATPELASQCRRRPFSDVAGGGSPAVSCEKSSAVSRRPFSWTAWTSPRLISSACFAIKSDIIELSGSCVPPSLKIV